MSTFGICDENIDGKLKMNEIHQDNCLDTLETMFGLTKSGLNEVFFQIDTNADMMISFEEASIAFDRIDFGFSDFLTEWKVGRNVNFDDTEVVIAKILVNYAYENYGGNRTKQIKLLLEEQFGGYYNCWWVDGSLPFKGYNYYMSKLIYLKIKEDDGGYTGPYCYEVRWPL